MVNLCGAALAVLPLLVLCESAAASSGDLLVELGEGRALRLNCADGKQATVDVDFNGLGTCSVTVCCPNSCDQCDKSENCYGNCCAQYIASVLHETGEFDSDLGQNCRVKDPPCLLSPSPDPCYTSPTGTATVCQRGARCGVAWGAGIQGCGAATALCACGEVGNYAGAKCEIACATQRAPCGRGVGGYTDNSFWPNDKCCLSSEVCLKVEGKYGWTMECHPKNRPLTCTPNPCRNGGECYAVNYYGDSSVKACRCASGWSGTFCTTAA